jgi:hypothetical protein
MTTRAQRRLASSFAVLILAGVVAAPAVTDAADTLTPLRAHDLVERGHTVSVAIGHGHARLTVRRTVYNSDARQEQATFGIELPSSAVVTGLRTRDLVDGEARWFTASLLAADAAAVKYRGLTGTGGHQPTDSGLLSWMGQTSVMLRLFPVAPREETTVEYTLLIPTSYSGGHDRLSLTAMGTEDRLAAVTVEPLAAGERLFANDLPLAPGAPVELTRETSAALSVARAGGRGFGGALAVVPFGKERVLLRQRIEAAPRLAEVPRGARVVVIVDTSRSISARSVDAEVAAARAYLAHFADAQVETLLVDRRVQGLHGGFVPVKDALAALARLTVVRRNGSRVDDAIARASALLAAAPASAPRRVLVLTDTRTRDALTQERLRGLAAGTGAVVHVGVVAWGSPNLERDDEHPWARITRPTGGLVWSAVASDEAADADAMRERYEEWARPRRVDHVRVSVPGLDAAAFDYPKTLEDGQGWEDTRVVDRRVGWLKIEGEMWSKPVAVTLVQDEAEARVTAALFFGGDLDAPLTDPEMMTLARVGHAVTPLTSLLAVAPGARPPIAGLEEGNGWSLTIGDSCGCSHIPLSGIGEGGAGPAPRAPDRVAWLRAALAPGWRACGGGDRHAQVTLETTFAEVVDVGRASVSGDAAGKLSRCLEESAWSLDLDPMFDNSKDSFLVEL